MNFLDLTIVFLIAFILGYLVNLLKQPPLIGYILAGTILGPLVFNKIQSVGVLEELAHIGIAFLLYIVGLHLNEKEIKELGPRPLLIGFLQIFLTSIVSFLIFFKFFPLITSIILSIALSFSSTIIIVKLLSDKEEIDELYGKILISILLIQDIVAAIFLITIDSLKSSESNNLLISILFLVFKAIGLIFILRIIVNKFINKIFNKIAKNQELIFLFSIAWCFCVASLFTITGFSLEIGSLVAGILLASSPYQLEISSRIKPLRDFFLVIFFLLLGLKINKINLTDFVILELMLLITLFLKPLITFFILKFFKYSEQVRFLSSISLGQISAFSLIIVLLAEEYGLINSDIVTLVTITMIISISISSYLIKYNFKIFHFLVDKGFIKYNNNYFEVPKESPNIVIFGYDRIGFSLFRMIKKLNKSYLIIDYNPSIIQKLKRNHIKCLYGDANDLNLLEDINFSKTKMVISTIPIYEINKLILDHVKKKNKDTVIILTSHKIQQSLDLYNAGADYVILPHFLGGEYVATFLENNFDNLEELLKEKIKHINELQKRKKEGIEHPTHKNSD